MNLWYVFLKIIGFYFAGGLKKKLIFYPLLDQSSFRDSNTISQLKIPFVYFKQALLKSLKSGGPYDRSDKTEVVLFDANPQSAGQRINYLNAIRNCRAPTFIITRQGLRFTTLEKVFALLILGCSLVAIFLFAWGHRRRSLSIFQLEFIEIASLIGFVRKNRVAEFYFFNAFENDANLIAAMLLDLQCPFVKIPSPNPISRLYQHNITDRFAFTAPYQRNEYKSMASTWLYNELVDFPGFKFHELKAYKRKSNNDGKYEFKLGYISSGMWLRVLLGHTMVEDSLIKSENDIIQYLKKNWKDKILVSLHPIEKSSENIKNSIRHYHELFGDNAVFMDFEKPTYSQFDRINLSITAHSSTNMERLYCGYKALFAPIHWEDSIFAKDSQLRKISIFSEKDLLEHITNDLELTEEEFFENYNLHMYLNDQIQ